MFDPYLQRWHLIPDGDAITSPSAHLLPVRQNDVRCMLKLALTAEEGRGGAALAWWNGNGAAKVLARKGPALLIERAECSTSLSAMARSGKDDDACRIICDTVALLHARKAAPPDGLVSLDRWFQDLWPVAKSRGGMLGDSADAARHLLVGPQDIVVLHGDIHHGNVLDFGDRGWLAIDPKGLWGERAFDYANIFLNPDLARPARPVAVDQRLFLRRLDIVTGMSGVARKRMLQWILAWCGLSAVWFLEEGMSAPINAKVAEMAAAELSRLSV
ncbi:aminoglycoside phosphotransferase family protein [Paracoccus aestuariivivens]|uniref:APH(6) family putative aminoglycoside O-phosphotransferase n=1 Tax=Paracoccus aestuariivivens TaxID=1820333 RepID=A0A6L6J7D0_9RHOB|nr:aminoglycoside phosphotransferase family protein [Paracoccus aestuariivivens]MTH77850.1 APH(6) family putative aminoglycoside O-phosphotransferase [Paracoccus aestuariivivens]